MDLFLHQDAASANAAFKKFVIYDLEKESIYTELKEEFKLIFRTL